MKENHKAALVGFISNVLLSAMKLYSALITGSLALFSDAINSITDMVSSLSVWFGVRVSSQEADEKHPYGHLTAEPVAALIIAIFMAVVGFEVVKNSIIEFFNPSTVFLVSTAVVIMVASLVIKVGVWIYVRSAETNSPALEALSTDYRNDILLTALALTGYLFGANWNPLIDLGTALIIGIFIVWAAFDIGLKNINFLMGASPPKHVLNKIRRVAQRVKGVVTTNDIYGHYSGNKVHAEVHININDNLNTVEGHAISKDVQRVVESLPIVSHAFVHIDPEKHRKKGKI